jgi:GT2 family glycosyltransferase
VTVVPTTRTDTCTVVVCTYSHDRLGDLTACLDSIAAQTRPADEVLVVVDHNESLLELLSSRAGITAIANTSTKGLSGARNTGVQQAAGEIVVFIDDDAVAAADWLDELLQPFDDAEVAAVGGHIDPNWPTERPWWFPPHLDWTVGCSIPTLPPQGGSIRNVYGASAAFRRADLEAAGGFTTELGRLGENAAGCEETDICIRIRQGRSSADIVYAPRSAVRHRVTDERATVRYVMRRCLAEGKSKALLARRVGGRDATGDERAYTLIIGRAVLRDLAGSARRPALAGRAAVLVGGLACASVGYVQARLSGRFRQAVA